jgi:hypothetical protein
MFLVNSRHRLVFATLFGFSSKCLHLPRARLLPKLRRQFAEFLRLGSLKRLGILSPPTCVGLRYGLHFCYTRRFSWKHGVTDLSCPKTQLGNCLSLKGAPLVSYAPSLTTTTQTDNGLSYPSPSLLATIAQYRYRNINLFAIAYAFRPRLRTRLTPGGLTWPGNPWVYGERVSHSFFRYSLWHNLLSPLQSFFRSAFTAKTMLPYHSYVPWIV